MMRHEAAAVLLCRDARRGELLLERCHELGANAFAADSHLRSRHLGQ